MSYQTNDFYCQSCGHVMSELVKRSERDNPIDCPACTSALTMTRGLPREVNIRTEKLSRTFLDGRRPDSSGALADIKSAAELKKKAASMRDGPEKQAIKAEATIKETGLSNISV